MKTTLLAMLMLLASIACYAFTEKDRDTIPPFIGVSFSPSLKWYAQPLQKADGEFLNYNFRVTSMSSYEGSFGIRRIGARVGLSAQVDDNLIGKIHRYGGYFGLKGYWLKIQGGKIEGNVQWAGALPPGFSSEYHFSNRYFSVEMLKTFKKKRYIDGKWEVDQLENQMGFYWSIGYTTLALPVKVTTLTTPGGKENQRYGVPAYDTLFTGKYYTAGFGFDMLRQLCLVGGKYGLVPGQPPMRFALYASTQDKFGFGPTQLSDHAKEMGEALNPGKTMVNIKGYSAIIHYSLSIGFRYIVVKKPAFVVIAAGYDLEGAALTHMKGASTSIDLGYDTNMYYINHGPSFKIFVSWVGRQ